MIKTRTPQQQHRHDLYMRSREKVIARQKLYYQSHRAERVEYGKNRYKRDREKILAYSNERYLKNRERMIAASVECFRQRWRSDPYFRLVFSLRSRAKRAIRKARDSESVRIIKYAGCTWDELRNHITSQFEDGMSWDNYGHKTWHIDHIRPVHTFDLRNQDEVDSCFHYTNLRPLWASANLSRTRT